MWVYSRDQIEKEFLEFFGRIFSKSANDLVLNCDYLIPDQLSTDIQESLISLPDYEEICKTLFSMGSTKALGPDGMSALFFKHYWQTVGDDFCETILNFFRWVGYILRAVFVRVTPLSPYLFIWAAEILSRLIHDALRSGNIKGIKLSRGGPTISHIFFADDLILVGKANVEEARGMWNCLEKFYDWSGQRINKLKTTTFFSKNITEHSKEVIKVALGIGSPVGNPKYLGLPLFHSRGKDADFNFIVENLASKLHGWKAKTLSKAGRATLIKFVGLAMTVYAMQSTKLTNRLCSRIDGMVRDFWWSFEKGNHGIHLRAWDKLCLPKSWGGLGFRKTKEMNQAFLAKWGWKLLTGCQSLCCRVLKAKYLKGQNILRCKDKTSDSWFYKSVVKANEILRKGACKVITDELLTESGNWDTTKLNNLFTRETVAAILKGDNPLAQGKDHWIWTKEGSGRFSCKSAYLIQALQCSPHCEVAPSLWNKLWNSKILITEIPLSLYSPRPPADWNPPPQDWIKINYDAKVGGEHMCVAVVARDYLSRLMWVFTAKMDFSDALCEEAVAVCLALEVAKDKGHQFILVESDSKIVINTLNGLDPRWEIENYSLFCKRFNSSFASCLFCFSARSYNFMAHNVANWAFTHNLYGCIDITTIPKNIYCNDREV
uniref:RNase H type-1 domain-containing protein n=1 Tax=Cannabis sativa TaxID=3483 RepID=A0A803P6J3_CANSA